MTSGVPWRAAGWMFPAERAVSGRTSVGVARLRGNLGLKGLVGYVHLGVVIGEVLAKAADQLFVVRSADVMPARAGDAPGHQVPPYRMNFHGPEHSAQSAVGQSLAGVFNQGHGSDFQDDLSPNVAGLHLAMCSGPGRQRERLPDRDL